MTEHEKLVDIILSTDLGMCFTRLMDANNIADNLIANNVAQRAHAKWQKQWCDNNMIGHEYEECPICGCMILDTEKFWDCTFCPNCGTDMS